MFKEQRQALVLQEIKKNGFASINDLCSLFNVSRATMHRDLIELEDAGKLRKAHGGAAIDISEDHMEPPFSARQDLLLPEKARIAKAAHNLISENETILLGAGTTILELSKLLGDIDPLYIATCDLICALELCHYPNITLLVLGGIARPNHYSLNGPVTNQAIRQIHADIAFMSADAVDFNTGFMNYSPDETETNKIIVQATKKLVALCDHEKFERIAFINTYSIDDADILITGKEIKPEYLRQLESRKIEVILV